jgi:uncharacterized damage-inducible protein DinB
MSEAWLSGPVEGVAQLLMPPAHTFLQVRYDARALISGLPAEILWRKVGASASIGFHAIHIAGATDRLMTYARGEQLSAAQLEALRGEAALTDREGDEVLTRIDAAVDSALAQIRATPAESLLTPRAVGRQRLPSTTFGLIVHAAEHALRHAGQIATLRKVHAR